MASIRTQTETSGKSCFWSIFSHIGHILSASNMYKYVQICTCTYLSILHPYLCGQYAPNMGQNKWACIGPYWKIQKISIWVDMHQYVQIREREIGDAGVVDSSGSSPAHPLDVSLARNLLASLLPPS